MLIPIAKAAYIKKKREYVHTDPKKWEYHFNKKSKTVECDYCTDARPLQKNSGTNKHWDHLKQNHRQIWDRYKSSEDSNRQLNSRNGSLKILEALHFSQAAFDESLAVMFVQNNLSFNALDKESFQKPFKLLQNDINIISSDTLKRRVMDLYEFHKTRLIQELALVNSKISFTTDCWTSPNNIAFIGVTAHWIDDAFTLKSVTLDFVSLSSAHSGENICKKFVLILEQYSLGNKILAVTLDNASNNDSFIHHLNQEVDIDFNLSGHIRCFAHVVNLGAQAALAVILYDLSELRRLIKNIRSSPQSTERFNAFLKFCSLSILKALLDTPTRWNSTVVMIERALELKRTSLANNFRSYNYVWYRI